MFQINLRMIAQPHHAVGTIKALRQIASGARLKQGYLRSRMYQDVENAEAFCFQEDWGSESTLKSHIRSRDFTNLLMLMETAAEAPALEVRSVAGIHGLEYIEAVRFSSD
jgi:quinol monooxygenase YgiN